MDGHKVTPPTETPQDRRVCTSVHTPYTQTTKCFLYAQICGQSLYCTLFVNHPDHFMYMFQACNVHLVGYTHSLYVHYIIKVSGYCMTTEYGMQTCI
jgi:hypothetical protein